MQQKDYILQEIEKIGKIIKTIQQKIFGENDFLDVKRTNKIDDAKKILSEQLNFDVDLFLRYSNEEMNEYIDGFDGFNTENLELLAELFTDIGISSNCDKPTIYLEKALFIYERVNHNTRTFSLIRETNIAHLKKYFNQK